MFPFKRADRRIVLAVADTHGGHSLGLLNPDTELVAAYDDYGRAMYWCPPLTVTQKRLWPLWIDFRNQVVDYADGCEIVVVHAGDPTHGEKHPGGNIPGIDLEDQRTISFWNLKPLFALPNVKKGRLYTGTPAHVEPGFSDARVADKLAKNFPKKEILSVHHSRSAIGQEFLDVAHTGPHPGSRDWLRGNVALLHLRDRVYRDRRMNKTPATVYLRAHRHVYVHVTLNDMWWHTPSVHHLVVVPSFCGFTSYARSVTQSEPELVNGMVAFEIIDGKLRDIKPFVDYTDLRLEETL
jgi:hypothetical protein